MQIHYLDSLLRVKKEYARMLEPVCKKWGLTRNELDILLFLNNNPGLDRAVDIVTRRGIAKSHVSLSVGDLELRGLLRRRLDPADRRTVHLELTESALPAAREGAEAQRAFFDCIFAGLTDQETALYWAVVEKICRNIENLDRN